MTTRSEPQPAPEPVLSPSPSVSLDCDRLDVYRLALDFHSTAADLLARRVPAELRSQLERASLSVVLNIAEGTGRTSRPDKRRFYDIARGSAVECAAILDVLRLRRLADPKRCITARTLLARIFRMLTRLGAPPR